MTRRHVNFTLSRNLFVVIAVVAAVKCGSLIRRIESISWQICGTCCFLDTGPMGYFCVGIWCARR